MNYLNSVVKLLLLPVSENGRPPFCNYTSGFDLDLFIIMGMTFCLGLRHTTFHRNRSTHGGVMMLMLDVDLDVDVEYIDFSRWRPAAMLDFVWVILDHPRSATLGTSLVYKFGVDRFYGFGHIAILRFGVLPWKC